MKEMGIKAQWVKPWAITTIDSDFSNELQNILDEQFTPDRPNAVWCNDITYIWTTDGFVHLTSIMDLYSRKIIAWTLSQTLDVSCVIDTIKKAKARHNTELMLIIHSEEVNTYPRHTGKLLQKYSAVTQKRPFHGTMHVSNRFMLLSNGNG